MILRRCSSSVESVAKQNSSWCVPRQLSSAPWKHSSSGLPTVASSSDRSNRDNVMRHCSSCRRRTKSTVDLILIWLFIGAVDHIKDQRTGLINTTFILVGPYWWGPKAMAPLDSRNPALAYSAKWSLFVPVYWEAAVHGFIYMFAKFHFITRLCEQLQLDFAEMFRLLGSCV